MSCVIGNLIPQIIKCVQSFGPCNTWALNQKSMIWSSSMLLTYQDLILRGEEDTERGDGWSRGEGWPNLHFTPSLLQHGWFTSKFTNSIWAHWFRWTSLALPFEPFKQKTDAESSCGPVDNVGSYVVHKLACEPAMFRIGSWGEVLTNGWRVLLLAVMVGLPAGPFVGGPSSSSRNDIMPQSSQRKMSRAQSTTRLRFWKDNRRTLWHENWSNSLVAISKQACAL